MGDSILIGPPLRNKKGLTSDKQSIIERNHMIIIEGIIAICCVFVYFYVGVFIGKNYGSLEKFVLHYLESFRKQIEPQDTKGNGPIALNKKKSMG